MMPTYNMLHFYNKFLRFFISRVEIFCTAVGEEPFGMSFRDMVGSYGRPGSTEYCAIRIAPGVEFHASLMCFFDHELKGIVVR